VPPPQSSPDATVLVVTGDDEKVCLVSTATNTPPLKDPDKPEPEMLRQCEPRARGRRPSKDGICSEQLSVDWAVVQSDAPLISTSGQCAKLQVESTVQNETQHELSIPDRDVPHGVQEQQRTAGREPLVSENSKWFRPQSGETHFSSARSN